MEASGRFRRGTVELLAVLAGALLVHGVVQAAMPGFADRDAWFHSRLAALLLHGDAPWHGLDFPWAAYSAYADFPADWALGWHWLLAPFTLLGTVSGTKVAIVAQAAGLTVVLFGVLRRAGVRNALLWTALLLTASSSWLYRTHMGRPTPLVVALLLVLLAAVLERRGLLAAGVAAAALLVYQVPLPALLVGAGGCAGLWVAERRPPWRLGLAVLGGVAVGVLAHPGFWSVRGGLLSADRATFHVWGLMAGSLEVAAQGGRVVLGDGWTIELPLPLELGAPTWRELFRGFWLPLLGTAYAALAAGYALLAGRARTSALPVATALLALLMLAGTLRSGRFFEYWQPFAVLALAVAVAGPVTTLRPAQQTQLAAVAAAVGLLFSLPGHPGLLHQVRVHGDDPGAELRPAVEAVRARARPGDLVWHGNWDDFAPLFHHAPELRYIVGMDPWYLLAHDEVAARVHTEVVMAQPGPDADATRGEIDGLDAALRDGFGARFVVLWSPPRAHAPREHRYAGLEELLRRAPWAEVLHDSPAAVAFELRPD